VGHWNCERACGGSGGYGKQVLAWAEISREILFLSNLTSNS